MGVAMGVAVGVGFGVGVGLAFGVGVGLGRGVPVGLGEAVGCLVAVGVTVTVGVLVGDPPKTWGCVAKKTAARMTMMSTARISGSHQLRPGPGRLSLVTVVRPISLHHALSVRDLRRLQYSEDVKRVYLTMACLAIVLPALSACGSSAPPPFAVSCKTHQLTSGAYRVKVTITNNTSKAGRAIIYGRALTWLRHIQPVLTTAQVIVTAAGSRRSYIGFVVPGVKSKDPAHLLLRFAPAARGTSIVATGRPNVQAADWHVLDNNDCVIRTAS